MRKTTLMIGLAAAFATFSIPASANHDEAVPGMLVGAGIGAVVGGPPGAAVGAVLGGIIASDGGHRHDRYSDRRYDDRRYDDRRYRDNRGDYDRGYRAPPVAYQDRAPVYAEPRAYREARYEPRQYQRFEPRSDVRYYDPRYDQRYYEPRYERDRYYDDRYHDRYR